MWRKYSLLVVLTILVVGGAFFLSQSAAAPNESDYVKAVKNYQAISIDEVEQKVQDEEEFILYIGRETCPYCRDFVPKLTEAVERSHATIYYLDSESDPNGKIQQFRQSQGLTTVPSLTYYKSGKLSGILRKGSQATLSEIENFLALQGQ
ncbi:TPA: thioredoxin [Streptococcus suis]|uniref:thioredoxin n=1 Tax=Streptococcus suis TaxID=1307 RepID=UPI001ABE214B|nr:thioredoxin [Streptococcus suis]MBO4112614.1 thioredoxin [Streptococcus suis]HEM3587743.1 thioredoxin [Streptococcus suis]